MSNTILSLLSKERLDRHYRSGFWRQQTIYALAREHARQAPDRGALRDRRRRACYRAQKLDRPPYEAYAVTTGITFTFGGLKITTEAAVEDTAGRPIPGLYAAGEIAGSLYYHNYASGTGLMAGAVFGRIAGRNAAAQRG